MIQPECVLPGGRRPNLASAALAGMLRRLPADHLAAFGQPLVAVETFTDPGRGPGTVYAAAGFTRIGLTAGYSRARSQPLGLRVPRRGQAVLAAQQDS